MIFIGSHSIPSVEYKKVIPYCPVVGWLLGMEWPMGGSAAHSCSHENTDLATSRSCQSRSEVSCLGFMYVVISVFGLAMVLVLLLAWWVFNGPVGGGSWKHDVIHKDVHARNTM